MNSSVRIFAALLFGTLAAAAPGDAATASEEAWTALAKLRTQVERSSPMVANFRQTMVAPGFSTGDAEEGRVFLDLPECFRWDYSGEFPETFLLCGHLAHTWNEGESSGRRQFLGPEERPGLELLRLEVAELRLKYRAQIEPRESGDTGGLVVRLVPFALESPGNAGPIRGATLAISSDGSRLAELSYEDDDGNLTRFEFSDYQPLREPDVFDPPEALTWLQ